MDDGIPIGMILLFATCLTASFFFSATEMAFASVSRIRMRSLAEDGNRRAQRVLSILDRFDLALSTILIGNNIANIGLATVATLIATRLWGVSAVTAATLITTAILFLLGETLPKSLAKAYNERFALAIGGVLAFLMRVLGPLARLLTAITGFIARPLRKGEPAPTVTNEELDDIIEDAVEDGALNEETGALVRSAIRYGKLGVRDVLTPWKDVRKLPVSAAPEETLLLIKEGTVSRLPVIDEIGAPIGVLRARKYLKVTLRLGTPPPASTVMDDALSVSDTAFIDSLLPMMSAHKAHIAFVRDGWDNVLGIVTIEDILERLVGDIFDEEDALPIAKEGDASC